MKIMEERARDLSPGRRKELLALRRRRRREKAIQREEARRPGESVSRASRRVVKKKSGARETSRATAGKSSIWASEKGEGRSVYLPSSSSRAATLLYSTLYSRLCSPQHAQLTPRAPSCARSSAFFAFFWQYRVTVSSVVIGIRDPRPAPSQPHSTALFLSFCSFWISRRTRTRVYDVFLNFWWKARRRPATNFKGMAGCVHHRAIFVLLSSCFVCFSRGIRCLNCLYDLFWKILTD